MLNAIACGRPLGYLDDALGKPLVSGAIRDCAPGRLYRAYRNAYVIVAVTASGPDKSVDAFSITVLTPKFHFRTRELKAGLLDLSLDILDYQDRLDLFVFRIG
ncbi:hypothetical protein [Amycolatopsis sp. cmx-8-4]|uniref:hypothetical protein n=1 Tax=Amycolatopsis sp. cmx-8-4 TaxID=2790947 RepID=UPI00397A67E3